MGNEEARETEDSTARSQVGTGPGERLQAARIKKGLSLEDVANRMHLSAGILEAIEENNFDEITAPIFVKGYLRSYARIVSLSEDEMIQQYVDFYSEEDPPISSTSNMVPELTVADARIKWTTYLVILVLGVLLAAWWWNKQQNEEPAISLETQSPTGEVVTGREQTVVDSNIEAGSEPGMAGGTVAEPAQARASGTAATEPQGIDVGDAQQTPAASAEEASAEADVSAAVPIAVVTEANSVGAGAEAQPEVEPAVEPDAEVEPEARPEAEAEVDAKPEATESVAMQAPAAEPAGQTRQLSVRTAASGSDRLEIIVHADTWADVKDANNYQLLYDLLRAGNRVKLTGEAPFAVFLGNGHGVELLINDEEIGITSKIRNDNTARLSIGG